MDIAIAQQNVPQPIKNVIVQESLSLANVKSKLNTGLALIDWENLQKQLYNPTKKIKKEGFPPANIPYNNVQEKNNIIQAVQQQSDLQAIQGIQQVADHQAALVQDKQLEYDLLALQLAEEKWALKHQMDKGRFIPRVARFLGRYGPYLAGLVLMVGGVGQQWYNRRQKKKEFEKQWKIQQYYKRGKDYILGSEDKPFLTDIIGNPLMKQGAGAIKNILIKQAFSSQ